MTISVGYIRSNNQIMIQSYHPEQNKLEQKLIDPADLTHESLSALYYDQDEHYSMLSHFIKEENNLYPIVDAKLESLNIETFEQMETTYFLKMIEKISQRWCLQISLKRIENSYAEINHFKNLWSKDRLSFFEEFWYWLKRLTLSHELTLIFHDVIQTELSDEEIKESGRKEKPKLVPGILTGTKKAEFKQGTQKEKDLLTHYLGFEKKPFEVLDYNPQKGELVMMANKDNSPILIMSRVTTWQPLQAAILKGFFNT